MPPATTSKPIRIGTRGSPLALAQADLVKAGLLAAHPELDESHIEIVAVTTRGDKILDRPLAELGGKGLFTQEIESGLLNGALDIAVHSMKDLETELPDGLHIACLLPREDVRDAFICLKADGIDALPAGSVVGTASLRRQAQIRRRRPDLKVEVFRGNLQTRLRKLQDGVADATLLAMAGLRRMGLAEKATQILSVDDMLPAIAQGAVGVEARSDDDRMAALLGPLNHRDTEICVTAERALLAALDGSCRTPIAGLAVLDGGRLKLKGEVLRPDGSECFVAERDGAPEDAAALGRDAGEELRHRAGPDFFSS